MNAPTPGSVDLPVPEGKIFPRNLTARADHVVRGNPSGSRPESGVDNCFPGLEFDQRNLEKAFFPGLTVDFHHASGPRVLAVTGGVAADQGITAADLDTGTPQDPRPLYLWAVCGRTTVDQEEQDAPVFHATERTGLELWRRVHDLLPGRVAIVLGRTPGSTSPGAFWVPDGGLNRWRTDNRSEVQFDADGVLEWAILVADRARYVDPDGVIDPDVYQAGDLTRSLCAPWQYDFRECGCYYWAASKPDISTSSDGVHRNLNFQRRDRTTNPPEPDIPTIRGRAAKELDHPALIANWNVLPVVLNGREDDSMELPDWSGLQPMTRAKVIRELERLAGVEHALCLEYLYAHYSLNAPPVFDPAVHDPATPEGARTRKIYAAAAEVFSVAVDEMRHLRWVNEMLGTLGRPLRLEPPRPDTVIQLQTGRRFELKPLTPEQLDWFIAVERPSAVTADPQGIDGMYVKLHETIVRCPELFPEADRLAHLIKLVIDEGNDHYRRFTAVKAHLAELSPDDYLRPLSTDPGTPLDVQLVELSALNYTMLLGALEATLKRGDTAGGVLIEQARRTMSNLHELNHLLASRGVAPRFTKLPAAPVPVGEEAIASTPASASAPASESVPARAPGPELADGQAALAAARASGTVRQSINALAAGGVRAMMTRHQADTDALIAAFSLR
ncbi:ferritin-like domain-containing protein [Streptomyces sp. NPDC001549]|uniref:ferritin-like domain-containing protein n=1 Tax=Streptomyces sp. NPDC001549 TaxID=3364586 RepID=UPI0036BB64D3